MTHLLDYKDLFRKLERTLDRIDRSTDVPSTLSAILQRLVDDFKEDLGLVGGRIYARRGSSYRLEREHPASIAPRGFRIPVSYPPLRELLDAGFVFHRPGDPGVDSRLEEKLGVESFAAICIGEHCSHFIAFSLAGRSDRDHVVYLLNTIRHVINLKLRKDQLEDGVAQVREIQQSLLPKGPPRFGAYDVWGRMEPAEEVGGDLYDFIEVSARSLGIAVADSAGHGLPAALQARDAIIGLRMGVEERLRITATIEKLNSVVSRSALASRFISLFYGELDANGTLVYCNAGHPPPLLWRDGTFTELRQGGTVLGPNPVAQYERGYTTMTPGSVLLAVTDGITEAEDSRGEMFGTARLEELVRARHWGSARELVELIFDAVRRFSGSDVPRDDQTVVAVVAPPAR